MTKPLFTIGEIEWLSKDPEALKSLITYHGINQDMGYNVGHYDAENPSVYEDARIKELKEVIQKLEDEL